MRQRLTILTLVLLGSASAVTAQTRPEPQLMLSVFGGIAGGTNLWRVDRQPLLVLSTATLSVQSFDTLRFARRIRPGLAVGVNATYFPSSNIGIAGEIALLGLGLEDNCEVIFEAVSALADFRNRQLCQDVNGRNGAASTVAFSVGGIARLAPAGLFTPYARLQMGVTSRQSTTTELAGRITAPGGGTITRVVYQDPGGSRLDPTIAGAIGMMVPISPGYQFRLELRDHLLSVREVIGPALTGSAGVPPTSSRLVHNMALVVYLDIVLERTRGRRY